MFIDSIIGKTVRSFVTVTVNVGLSFQNMMGLFIAPKDKWKVIDKGTLEGTHYFTLNSHTAQAIVKRVEELLKAKNVVLKA